MPKPRIHRSAREVHVIMSSLHDIIVYLFLLRKLLLLMRQQHCAWRIWAHGRSGDVKSARAALSLGAEWTKATRFPSRASKIPQWSAYTLVRPPMTSSRSPKVSTTRRARLQNKNPRRFRAAGETSFRQPKRGRQGDGLGRREDKHFASK